MTALAEYYFGIWFAEYVSIKTTEYFVNNPANKVGLLF